MYSLYKNEYRIFKLVETIIRKGLGRKEKNRGDKPNWAIIHIYMEMPQGNSLCSYLKQAKMSFFIFSCFSYTKSENRRVEQVLPGRAGSSRRRRRWGNGEEG
jgi:hypothetical protein